MTLTLLCALLATEAWSADAAPGDADSTFVPVTPCRLFDFRPGKPPVDGRKSPLGPDTIHTQRVTGDVGNCNVPTDAVAVAMNVTITNPTAQSNLRVFPADVAGVPTVSSLNWVAAQSPTPNKVDVQLSPDGRIKLYNQAGSVNVIADVVGYYTSSSLREIQSRLATLEGSDVAPSPSGFSARVTGYGPGSTITTVSGDVTNGLSIEENVRVDVGCPDGTVEIDYVFGVPPGQTRGWSVLCSGSFTSGATLTTVRV